jgi:hypothetical protein
MKDKIILVFYLNLGNAPIEDYQRALNSLIPESEDIITFCVKTEKESRVECINPKLVDNNEYKQVKNILDNLGFEIEKSKNISILL